MVEHQTPKSRFWGHIPTPGTHGYPWGGVVAFSNDPGQLRVRSLSVSRFLLQILEFHKNSHFDKFSQILPCRILILGYFEPLGYLLKGF